MGDFSINNKLIEIIPANLEDEKISYNVGQERSRCNGHIIHLAVCVFLFGQHANVKKTQIESLSLK